MKTIKELATEFRQNAYDYEMEMNKCVDRNKRSMYAGMAITWNAAAFELEQNMENNK